MSLVVTKHVCPKKMNESKGAIAWFGGFSASKAAGYAARVKAFGEFSMHAVGEAVASGAKFIVVREHDVSVQEMSALMALSFQGVTVVVEASAAMMGGTATKKVAGFSQPAVKAAPTPVVKGGWQPSKWFQSIEMDEAPAVQHVSNV